MNTKISNHKDIAIKFSFKTLGEVIHKYFKLKGDYLGLRDTEVITLMGRNLRRDISYNRSGQIVNCVEMQTYSVDDIKLEPIAEYVIDVLRNDDQQLADAIILTTVNPKFCEKRIKLTDSLILEPKYIYISQDEVMEMFNNIENKILNNQILTSKEELEFIIIAIFLDNNEKEDITSRLCYLFHDYSKVMDFGLNLKISFVLWLIVDRNVKNQLKKEKLNDVINMEKNIDALQELINEEKQEDKIALKKANAKIRNFEIESKEDKNTIKEQNNKLKENETKLKEKDKMIQELFSIITKSKNIPNESLITMITTNYEG